MRAILQITNGAEAKRRILIASGQKVTLGRTPAADYQFPTDERMSGRHFSVNVTGQTCQVCDLNSRNGTFVDDCRIAECTVAAGSIIRAGDTTFTVTLEDLSATALARAVTTPKPSAVSNSGLSPGAMLALSLANKSDVIASTPPATPTPLPVTREPVKPPPAVSIPEPYRQALDDSDNIVKRNALIAAAWSGQPWVLDYCRAAVYSAAPSDAETWLLFAILGRPEDLPRILTVEHFAGLGPRRFAILAAFGHPQVMSAIMAGLDHPDPELSAAAKTAFTKMTGVDVPFQEPSPSPAAPAALFHDSEAATQIWLKLKRKFPDSTRWCRGFDLTSGISTETLTTLDLESRWEICLRSRFQRVWKPTPLDQEQLADKLSS